MSRKRREDVPTAMPNLVDEYPPNLTHSINSQNARAQHNNVVDLPPGLQKDARPNVEGRQSISSSPVRPSHRQQQIEKHGLKDPSQSTPERKRTQDASEEPQRTKQETLGGEQATKFDLDSWKQGRQCTLTQLPDNLGLQ